MVIPLGEEVTGKLTWMSPNGPKRMGPVGILRTYPDPVLPETPWYNQEDTECKKVGRGHQRDISLSQKLSFPGLVICSLQHGLSCSDQGMLYLDLTAWQIGL